MSEHGRVITSEKFLELVNNLRTIAPDTEREFLDLGLKLQGINAKATEITDNASSIVSLTGAGEAKGRLSVSNSSNTFEEVRLTISSNRSSFEYCLKIIDDLITKLENLYVVNEVISGVGKQIRMLGINLKIESARFDREGHGFNILAQEVAEIALNIFNNAVKFEKARNEIFRKIVSFQKTIKISVDKFVKISSQSTELISSSINRLKTLMEESASVAETLGEITEKVSSGTGSIVMAMQFHDITRQQLDNIADSLLELSASVKDDGSVLHDRNSAVPFYRTLSIQFAQLNSVVEAVQHARQNINLGLESLESMIDRLDIVFDFDNGGSKENERTINVLVGEAQKTVKIMDEGYVVASGMSRVIQEVISSASGMEKFLTDIDAISQDVKLLALNALAEATRTGDSGRTLKVLAQELNFISIDTISSIRDSVDLLKDLLSQTDSYSHFNAQFQEVQSDTANIAGMTDDMAKSLSEISREIKRLTALSDESSAELAMELSSIRGGIKFPLIMQDRITEVWAVIHEILEIIEGKFPGIELEMTRKDVEDRSDRYVMERERQIHEQVIMGGAIAAGRVSDAEEDHIILFEAPEEMAQSLESYETDKSGDDDIELWDSKEEKDVEILQDKSEERGENENSDGDDLGDNVELF